jgi:hypothetical protein
MTTTRHSRLGSLVAAGVIAVGALTALAPAAIADAPQSDGQIAANCKDAGGTFYHDVSLNGTRFATCCYKDAEGKYGCDSYVNGVYIGTSAEKKGPPVSGPAAPPGDNPPVAPPITNPPPAA